MKPLPSLLAATILFGALSSFAKTDSQVSVEFFHDTLQPDGTWHELGDYGYCWQPRGVDRDWRPYRDGRWVYTDAGWTWDSEETYAWAVYHYGRWANTDRLGWVWVPDTEWGPAWVSWRRSPTHVGWAPLPPEAIFDRSIGFSVRMDVDYDIGPTSYNFVEVQNFGAPRLRTVILQPRGNITLIQETTNITRVTYVNNVVHNEGPSYDVISRESTQPIRRLKLERREHFAGDPRRMRPEELATRVDGDSFFALAPSFDRTRTKAPRKGAAKADKVEVDRGWKNAGSPAEVARVRAKIQTEPAAPHEALPQPPAEKSAGVLVLPRTPATPPSRKGVKREVDASKDRPPAPASPETAPLAPNPVAEKPISAKNSRKADKPAPPRVTTPLPVTPHAETPEPPRAKKTGKPAQAARMAPDRRPAAEASEEKSKRKSPGTRRDLPVAPSRPKGPAGEVLQPPRPERPSIQSVERNPLPKKIESGKLQPRPPKPPVIKKVPSAPVPPQAAPPDRKRQDKEKDPKKEANP